MATGTVKFFNTEKGFGFISPDGAGKDLFVHKNDCWNSINNGDKVTYEISKNAKGPAAVSVRAV